MPPLHPLLGHLPVLARIMSALPKDAHPHYLPDQLRRAYPSLGPIFYIDAWPFATFTLVLASPSILAQVTTEHNSPKFPAIRDFLYPLTGGRDIVSMDGGEWKMWRSIFNPGFSASHLMTMVPDMIQETAIFCERLKEFARKGKVFRMKGLTDDLAMDIIGKVVLDSNLNVQRSSNPMVNALRRQMKWMAFGSEGNPLQQYHPLRPFVHFFNTWRINRYLSPEVDARFTFRKEQKNQYKDSGAKGATKSGKSVIDLALTAYLKQNAAAAADISNPDPAKSMDPTFKELAMNQVKLFLFSGHDTTSSSLCYTLYLLSTHPRTLSRVRAEHNEVFGPEPNGAAARITADPYSLNKLPYTTAVIKESLRLYPAASSTRSGEPGFCITGPDGRKYPTEDCLLWMISHGLHRDPAYWPEPDSFIPERWLVESAGDALYPVKGAWRPFEHGPRACIGVELSMIELKIVVVLVARGFELEAVYTDVDAGKRGGVRTVVGERAYQLGMTGQP
ncbi:MAG: hypothetical protein MMC33_005828, partial [Icmadophila ericetorum]|nr:hypothetical protein [Icmadophila ericetorum]